MVLYPSTIAIYPPGSTIDGHAVGRHALLETPRQPPERQLSMLIARNSERQYPTFAPCPIIIYISILRAPEGGPREPRIRPMRARVHKDGVSMVTDHIRITLRAQKRSTSQSHGHLTDHRGRMAQPEQRGQPTRQPHEYLQSRSCCGERRQHEFGVA